MSGVLSAYPWTIFSGSRYWAALVRASSPDPSWPRSGGFIPVRSCRSLKGVPCLCGCGCSGVGLLFSFPFLSFFGGHLLCVNGRVCEFGSRGGLSLGLLSRVWLSPSSSIFVLSSLFISGVVGSGVWLLVSCKSSLLPSFSLFSAVVISHATTTSV